MTLDSRRSHSSEDAILDRMQAEDSTGLAPATGPRSGAPAPGSSLYPTSPLGEKDPRIPTGRDVEWEPLVDYRRNGVSETTIHGAIAWASGSRLVHSFGGNVLCYGRSMMKPMMMKVFTGLLDP